ncbi:MAG: hypothetical protein Kow0031_33880 [Anaerolineae bacterium]
MKFSRWIILLGLLVLWLSPPVSRADAADEWWDEAWPYRIPVTVSGSGVAQVSINFTSAFAALGLNGALLDVRSLRVVPYSGTTPGAPIPYAESYSTMLDDADAPQIGTSNPADALAGQFIQSRTLFSRVPTDLYAARAAIAAQLTGPSASVSTDKSSVALNESFNYLLVYNAGDSAHTVTISDTVPTATTVLAASGSKSPAPARSGQLVTWTVALASQETVTLTIQAQAASGGLVSNQATFAGPDSTLTAGASLLVYTDQVFLPVVLK